MARSDKFLDALDQGFDAAFSALEATEARIDKVTRVALRETRSAEQEALAFTRRVLQAPANIVDHLFELVALQGRAQHRTIELTRELFAGAGEYGSELQASLVRLLEANQTLGEATLEGLREAFGAIEQRMRGEQPKAAPRGRARLTRIAVANGDQVA
jgi:hypothetical protein